MKNKGVRPVVKSAAYGGIGAGLIVVLLLCSSLLPFLEYTIPAAGALIIFFICKECSPKTAAGCYAASAILAVLLIPNKEAAILYALFFGYYPIFREFVQTRLPKLVRGILKFLVFDLTMIASYALLIFVFGLDELWEEINLGMQYGAVILLFLGNISFWLFDVLLLRAEQLYQAKQMGLQIRFEGYLARLFRRLQKK